MKKSVFVSVIGALIATSALAQSPEFKITRYSETKHDGGTGCPQPGVCSHLYTEDKIKFQSLMDDPIQINDVIH